MVLRAWRRGSTPHSSAAVRLAARRRTVDRAVYGDFMAIILEFAVAPPVAAWAEAWGKDLLGADQINTALIEVCKGRMPTDWEECGLGELGERLRAAASRPLVEPSSLAVFLDAADGGSLPPHRRPLIQQACP